MLIFNILGLFHNFTLQIYEKGSKMQTIKAIKARLSHHGNEIASVCFAIQTK